MRFSYFSILFLFLSHFLFSQSEKIDPKLLHAQDEQKVVVVLKEQADLSGANAIHGKDAKANFVFSKLQETAQKSQVSIQKLLKDKGITFQSFYIVNMIALNADKTLMEELALRSDVDMIVEDSRYVVEKVEEIRGGTERLGTWGIQKIKADSVWALGYTGQNVVVGGQDTGYDWDNDVLIDKYRGWNGSTANHNYNWHDAIHTNNAANVCGSDSPEPCDDHNHGSHTMGTMVGSQIGGTEIGVAPDAKWIGCRNMDNGDGVLSTYVECFEWFIAPYPVSGTPAQGDVTKAPHVINNSWGCPPSEGCNTSNFSIMEMALNNLRASGVVVVVSAGNSGPGCSSVSDPAAIFQNSFSIGASNSSDGIAGFSSRGPVTIDGSNRLKPNVTAPGVGVLSCIRNNGSASWNGTSMAGPHVAATVALMLSANPNLAGEVDLIESIIEETAVNLSGVTCSGIPGTEIPNTTFGWGRIDALAAVKRAIATNYLSNIKIDQFGYKNSDQKIAVLSNPQTGYNSTYHYTPSATVKVKNAYTHTIAFSGTPVAWNGGSTQTESGDKVWWFDFSALTTAGTYYISDNGTRSEVFEIKDDVYDDVLVTAFKTFYLQRCGTPKLSAHVSDAYADATCHAQDVNCHFINDPNNASLFKNMSGGWHDAGDYNKYVNFTYATLIDLLNAYEYNPEAWTDDMDIPESGNGIPDLLDEIKYELDWLLKMQATDGGVHCVVGVQNYASASPPSADGATRYYGPKTTSASFTSAAVFAYASRQFSKINNATAQTFAATLKTKAIAAYNWAVANPNITFYNSGNIAAGEQEINDSYEVSMRKMVANIYLYAATSSTGYRTYVESNYTASHLIQWSFVYPFENPTQQSLLFFAHLPNVNSGVKTAIISAYKNSMDNSGDNRPAFLNNTDAYRAPLASQNYVWGSNGVKTNMANLYQSYLNYDLNVNIKNELYAHIQDYAHYMHGVNPNGLCFLTNMADHGAFHSVNTIYHGWFSDGSALWDDVRTSTYGPAPGFIPGGPNPSWTLDGCCANTCSSDPLCTTLSPPSGQPIMKSFREWNTSWPQNSWEITETSIYVQASYLSMLSSLVNRSAILANTDSLVRIENTDLVLSNTASKLLLTSPNGSLFKIYIDGGGNVVSQSVPNASTGSNKIMDASLKITQAYKGIILNQGPSRIYRIFLNNGGNISTQTIAALPSPSVNHQAADLIIQDSDKGIILRDGLDRCYQMMVNDSGLVYVVAVSCY